MRRFHGGYIGDDNLIQPAQLNGSFNTKDSRQKKYKPTPRAAFPIRPIKTLLSPANKAAPLPHLFICLTKFPPELLEWQIKEAWKTLEVIRLKHSTPYHGTLAFSNDPTVLLWESHQKYLNLHLLKINAQDWATKHNLNRLSRMQINTLRLEFCEKPSFLKDNLLLESHEQYIQWLSTGRKYKRPTIHFPPATQWSKSIYPTETYAGE